MYNNVDMPVKRPITRRQKKAVHELVENGGNLSRALMNAGYSPKYAHNPKKFRLTSTFKELLDANLPDWLLAEKHQEALDAKAVDSFVFPLSITDEAITELIKSWGFELTRISHGQTNNRAYYSMPDHKIRLEAIKEGYKIKNKYEPEELVVRRKLEDLSDEELESLYNAKVKRDAEKQND